MLCDHPMAALADGPQLEGRIASLRRDVDRAQLQFSRQAAAAEQSAPPASPLLSAADAAPDATTEPPEARAARAKLGAGLMHQLDAALARASSALADERARVAHARAVSDLARSRIS